MREPTPSLAGSWWQLSAAELATAYRDGRLSPVGVVEACFGRIAALDPKIGAFVALRRDEALADAQASAARFEHGEPIGPLDGVPFAAKDNICCAGMPTTWGSPSGRDHRCDADETAVARLRDAGAILVGKTNVPEFTLDGHTANPLFGTTRNPWDLLLTPGGSSGGSVAAVAAGMVPLAIGTDGGGSIRRPASHTGLVGFKPSIGTVARDGGLPPLLLDFEVIGPIARNVDDACTLLETMAGPLTTDRLSFAAHAARKPLPPKLRIAYVSTIGDAPVDPQIAASCRRAITHFEKLGHRVVERTLMLDTTEITARWSTVGQIGLAHLFERHPEWAEQASEPFVRMAAEGARLPATALWALLESVASLRRAAAGCFEQVDLIVTPSAAALPWPTSQSHPPMIAATEVGPRGHAIFTGWVNAAGLPALALPCEPSIEGLPIGLQMIADYGTDFALLALGRQYEATAGLRWTWPTIANDVA